MGKKVDANKRQKSTSLLNRAFDLFIEKGVSKTSVSDIAERAGVAKGTFYLYFKDKYDIRNHLVVYKATQLFMDAYNALIADMEKRKDYDMSLEDCMYFIVDHILTVLQDNKPLLEFLHKDLSWGVFAKYMLDEKDHVALPNQEDFDFETLYKEMVKRSGSEFRDPDVMLFMIIELMGSTGYSCIMYPKTFPLDRCKPYLRAAIHDILQRHMVKETSK